MKIFKLHKILNQKSQRKVKVIKKKIKNKKRKIRINKAQKNIKLKKKKYNQNKIYKLNQQYNLINKNNRQT